MSREPHDTPSRPVIDPSASVHATARIGAFTVVEGRVQIGPDCAIGHHVVIHEGTKIGAGVRIDDHAVIGKLPMRAARSAITKSADALPPAAIGDACIVGTSAVIYAGATIGEKVLVADLATIREHVTVGAMTIVGRGVAIENKCTIGTRCKLETGSYVCALSEVGDDCFIAPEAVFTNDNFLGRTKERFKHHKGPTLKRGARIGANATLLPGKIIGEDALVAAGSVVTKDVPARMIVMGSPARVVRPVPAEQLIERQET